MEQPQAPVVADDLGATWAARSKASPREPSAPMYQAQPVSRRRREVLGQLLRAVAEAARGDDHRAGGDRVVADGDSHDGAVVGQQPVDPLAEGDVDVGLAAVPGEDVDDALAPADGHVDPRHPLLTAEDQRVVVLDAQVAEPLDGRPGELGEAAHDAGVDVPAVELHVVVEQRVRRRPRCPSAFWYRVPAPMISPPDRRDEPPTTPSLSATRTLAAPRSPAVSAAANPATPEPTTMTSTSRASDGPAISAR